MNRKTWDRLVSTAALVIAIVLVFAGGAAIYGGNFGRDNVTDRLAPEKVAFPPLEAMTPQEQTEVGDFAGEAVTTGPQAEAFARYIQGHLAEVNEGQTYSETSAAAREEGLAILLNAYGWWTVATIAVWAGWGMVTAGIILLVLSILGFVHARKTRDTVVVTEGVPEQALINA